MRKIHKWQKQTTVQIKKLRGNYIFKIRALLILKFLNENWLKEINFSSKGLYRQHCSIQFNFWNKKACRWGDNRMPQQQRNKQKEHNYSTREEKAEIMYKIYINKKICFLLVQQPPVGHGLLIHKVSRSHTTTHQNWQDSYGRVIGPSQRPLPDNTQHSQ